MASAQSAGAKNEGSFLGVSLDGPLDFIFRAGFVLEPLQASALGNLSGIFLGWIFSDFS